MILYVNIYRSEPEAWGLSPLLRSVRMSRPLHSDWLHLCIVYPLFVCHSHGGPSHHLSLLQDELTLASLDRGLTRKSRVSEVSVGKVLSLSLRHTDFCSLFNSRKKRSREEDMKRGLSELSGPANSVCCNVITKCFLCTSVCSRRGSNCYLRLIQKLLFLNELCPTLWIESAPWKRIRKYFDE